jgi:hypothetical protein
MMLVKTQNKVIPHRLKRFGMLNFTTKSEIWVKFAKEEK